jgi:hypothetical protein
MKWLEKYAAGREAPVSIVPGTGHMELVLTPVAVQTAVSVIGRLNARSNPSLRGEVSGVP